MGLEGYFAMTLAMAVVGFLGWQMSRLHERTEALECKLSTVQGRADWYEERVEKLEATIKPQPTLYREHAESERN